MGWLIALMVGPAEGHRAKEVKTNLIVRLGILDGGTFRCWFQVLIVLACKTKRNGLKNLKNIDGFVIPAKLIITCTITHFFIYYIYLNIFLLTCETCFGKPSIFFSHMHKFFCLKKEVLRKNINKFISCTEVM